MINEFIFVALPGWSGLVRWSSVAYGMVLQGKINNQDFYSPVELEDARKVPLSSASSRDDEKWKGYLNEWRKYEEGGKNDKTRQNKSIESRCKSDNSQNN